MPTEIQRPWCKCVFRNARSGLSFIKVATVVTSCSFAKAILAHLLELVKYLSVTFLSFSSNSFLLQRPFPAGLFSMFARCQSLSARPNIPHDFLFVNTLFGKITRNFEISCAFLAAPPHTPSFTKKAPRYQPGCLRLSMPDMGLSGSFFRSRFLRLDRFSLARFGFRTEFFVKFAHLFR